MTCLGLGAGLMSIYGFFVEDLATEFDTGLAAINAGPVALLLVPGIIGPLVGRLVDRVPVRRLMFIGATIGMLSLGLVSQAPSLLLAALAFLGFALGMSFYGPVVVNAMLGFWALPLACLFTAPSWSTRCWFGALYIVKREHWLLPPWVSVSPR
jgi:MFS family permease